MKKFQKHVIKKHKNRQNYMTHEEFYNGVINITSNVAGLLDEEPEYSNETSGNNANWLAAEKLECFGSTESVIVGMQYYKKKVSNGEVVTLEREPNNPYDSNAVRVENLGSEKVGYVRKEDAKAFARIMDGQLAKVEANIPYGAENKFRVPLHINCWGAPDKKDQVLDILRQHGLVVQVPQPGQEPNIAFDVLPSPTGMPSAMDYGHVMSSRTYVSPEEMQKEIDKMFETLEEGDKTTEAEPAKAIVRKLYPHQKQALNWMMCKENKNDLPPFWKETKTLYVNSLTRKMTKKRPASVRGGILADDMGLGKTLEMISLIMTNAADGKPLAEPIPNLCRDPLENREQDTLNAPNSGIPVTKTTNGERQEILGHMISSSLLSGISKQQHKPSEKTSMNCDSAIIKTSGVRAALVAELRRKLKRPAEPAVEDGGDQAVQLPAAKKVKVEDQTAENGTVRNDISDTGQPTSSHANMSTAPKYDQKGITLCTSHKPDEGKTPGLPGSSVSPLKTLKSWLAQRVKQQPPLPSSKTSSYVVVIDEDELPDISPTVVIEDLKVEDQNTEIDTDRNDISDTGQLMSSCANMNSAPQNENERISPHTLCKPTGKKTPGLPGSSASFVKRLKSWLTQRVKQQPTPSSSKTSSDVVVINDDDELPDILPPAVVEDLKVEDQTIEIDTDRNDISDTDQPTSSYANMNSTPQNENEGIYPHTLCKPAEKKTLGLPGSSASPLKTLRSWLTQKSKQQHTPPSSKTSSDEVIINDDDELPDIPPPAVVEDLNGADLSVGALMDVNCQTKAGNSIPFGTRGTLIICPLSVINNWQTQFLEHVDKTAHFNLLVYYGPKRPRDITFLRNQDVVITCYSTVASDYKSKHGSPLHHVNWLRVVLDEGHYIRNPAANMTMAVCELKAERRWVLTGTPIQNSLKDLWSLMNFLQVKPFTERRWWNITIAQPIGNGEKFALRRLAHLVGNLSLRRTKYQQLHGKRLVELPARHVYLEKISFGEEERQGYDVMQQEGRVIISRFFRQGTLLHHYSQVLVILLRLRQLCCHPHLVARAVKRAMEEEKEQAMQNVTDRDDKNDTSTQDQERQRLIQQLRTMMMSGSDEECPICLDSLKNATITFCAHIYCKACIEDVIDNEKPDPKCPLCRRSLDKNKLIEAPAETDKRHKDWDGCEIEDVLNPNDWQSSAKIDALMKALTELRQQDPSVKSIVVSQFTSLLSLIGIPLAMEGFIYTRLDGTMNVQDRQKAIDDFSSQEPDSPTIMLLSLKAGGVGINLTAASRVFLMDPAWNPAAEEQCFDRCHRLGQTKDVVITKFVIEDSVEERMLELQEKKKQLMQAAFYKKPTAEERRANMINMIRRLVNI